VRKTQRNPKKYRQTSARRVRLSKECWCDPCGTDNTSKGNFSCPTSTQTKHKRCVIRVAEGRHLQHRYYLCNSSFDDLEALEDHEKKDAHKKNAAAPDAATIAKAARAKAIADSPGAIEAAKVAIGECGGDYSKAISIFNKELDPVSDEPDEIFDFTMAAESVSDDTAQHKPTNSSRMWGSKNMPQVVHRQRSARQRSARQRSPLPKLARSSSKVNSAADTQAIVQKARV
jgi:hypothetical protein